MAHTDDDTLFGIARMLSELLGPDNAGWADMGRLLDAKPQVQDRLLHGRSCEEGTLFDVAELHFSFALKRLVSKLAAYQLRA